MAVLLQIRDAHKSYGHQILLDGAEASITDDTKVGFVGRNGTGKSTLLRILLGEEELDQGEVVRHPRLRLGYLRQHDPFRPGETALEFLMRDSGQPDWKCGEVAGQFELKDLYLNGPLSKLSGGWQTRVKLAALLLHEPNLLLLDEPTNFLDLRTQILLENFLKSYKEACLIVSHDREFLKATCDHTLDLSRGKLTMFPGKIDAFLEYQEERRLHDERANTSIMAKRRHLEEFIAKNKARASTASRAKSKSKQLERLEVVEIESDQPTAVIRAPEVEKRSGPALRCKNLSIGYAERTIATEINIEIDHGARAAIVGDNGQGKTTLLRTLVKSLDPKSGEARWGYGCEIGTYAQHVYTSLPENQTVLEYLEYNAAPGTKTQQILDQAGALLFRGEHVKKRISVLSGGERARLCLAGLMLSPYNILILDEPGNHLDVDTIESLANALLNYRGTVIFTSHDRHFMKRIATNIIEVRDGKITDYRGGYDAYLYSVSQAVQQELTTVTAGQTSKKSAKKQETPAKNALNNERELRKEVNQIERNIGKVEQKKRDLNARLMEATDPEIALKLHNEISALNQELETAELRWCELQELLADE